MKYSAFDRELLAVKEAIRHFWHFLEGENFTVFTDHRLLTTAIHSRNPTWSSRQHRHFAEISEMTTDLQHISGKNNIVVDALSRVFTIANKPIDWSTFATDQGTDPNILLFATAITGLKIDHVMVAGHSIVCDISSVLPRPLVPATWVQTVFDLIHSLSHPGVKASVRLVLCHFVWHNAKKDIFKPPICKNTPAIWFRFLKRLPAVLDMCMCILWDPCLSPKVADIFLLWWIVGPVGQKQSQCLT